MASKEAMFISQECSQAQKIGSYANIDLIKKKVYFSYIRSP